MLVRFTCETGTRKSVDWALDHVPRIGDTVELTGLYRGIVRDVVWNLSEISTYRFVEVFLTH